MQDRTLPPPSDLLTIGHPAMPTLNLRVRHTRELTDLDVECTEDRLGFGHLEWSLPIEHTALVLVDCWHDHPVRSFLERASAIMKDKLAPTVEALRAVGVPIVHAPAPEVARHYAPATPPTWDRAEQEAPPKQTPDWPPEDFRRRKDAYACFGVHRLPNEPRARQWHQDHLQDPMRIADVLKPRPEDVVIADGEQLHRFCRHRQVMHLLYAGFAANICLQIRDYGMRAMLGRGYNLILIRDATTAIEHAETVTGQWLTRAAVLNLEMKVAPSVTSDQVQRACAMAC